MTTVTLHQRPENSGPAPSRGPAPEARAAALSIIPPPTEVPLPLLASVLPELKGVSSTVSPCGYLHQLSAWLTWLPELEKRSNC